eukprot:COSAG01_NODE_3759_length_5723_cov_3.064900_3_plen_175_part_00
MGGCAPASSSQHAASVMRGHWCRRLPGVGRGVGGHAHPVCAARPLPAARTESAADRSHLHSGCLPRTVRNTFVGCRVGRVHDDFADSLGVVQSPRGDLATSGAVRLADCISVSRVDALQSRTQSGGEARAAEKAAHGPRQPRHPPQAQAAVAAATAEELQAGTEGEAGQGVRMS